MLELATLYAAPLIGAILGDLGADVVKVEPPEGDPMRFMGASRDGRSLVWAYVGRNKRSVVIDARAPEGRADLHALTDVADVVITNQPQSVLVRWQCTYDDIAARNPRAVVVEMSGYGADGPFGGLPANGTMSEAFGGAASMIGEPDGPPMLPSLPLGDTLAAWHGAMGALAACYSRDARGGTGQRVDVAMYEPILALLATAAVAWNPGDPPPLRNGSRVQGAIPATVIAPRMTAISSSPVPRIHRSPASSSSSVARVPTIWPVSPVRSNGSNTAMPSTHSSPIGCVPTPPTTSPRPWTRRASP